MPAAPQSPRLRQAVIAARDLGSVCSQLRDELGLGEPFADPGVAYFGLRNSVFALSDTFLEVVSPHAENTSAGRLIERRGGDCGYMLMFQVDDVAAARARAAEESVREVFEVSVDDMSEVHLHPADMRGAIVSLSEPTPPESWRWAGPDWQTRSVPLRVCGARIAVADPETVAARWSRVLGASAARAGIHFDADEQDRGPVEIILRGADRPAFTAGGVRFSFEKEE